jgi:putative ABC transport system permease protein
MQSEFGSQAPMGNQDELVILPNITLSKEYFDTIPTIDTTMVDGSAKYDTTYDIKSQGSSSSTSNMDEDMLQEHFRNLSSIKQSTIFNSDAGYDVFVNNTKISIQANYTDHFFWDVFNFKFLDGRPYDESDVEQESRVCVITEELATDYFGKSNVMGEFIIIDNKQYKIIGIVEKVKMAIRYLVSDIFIPFTDYQSSYNDSYFGSFAMIFQSDENLQKAKGEIESVAKSIPADLNPDYNEISVSPATYIELYAKMLYHQEDERKSLSFMRMILFGLLSLFILLPVLNLINLNVSRIMDRSSEIGVRKAFGATNSDILTQFVFENIIQTFLGGIIGFVLVSIAIYFINDGKYLGDIQLGIDYKFFFYSLVICLLFGLLSGILPAWKMSKTHIVNALKSKQL